MVSLLGAGQNDLESSLISLVYDELLLFIKCDIIANNRVIAGS